MLAVYLLLLAVTYILMRKGVAGEVFTGIVFSWQLLVMFLGLARLSTKPVALGIVLVFLGAFTMLPLFTDVFPGLSGLVSDKSFWIVVPIFVAAVILVSEFLRIRRRVARKKLLPAVQSGLGEDGTLYEKRRFLHDTQSWKAGKCRAALFQSLPAVWNWTCLAVPSRKESLCWK